MVRDFGDVREWKNDILALRDVREPDLLVENNVQGLESQWLEWITQKVIFETKMFILGVVRLEKWSERFKFRSTQVYLE